jgi:4-amino-4-deoxy-L-arabinose transferase-like glycosyltransferase
MTGVQRLIRILSSSKLPWILFAVALILRLIHISLLKQGFYFSDYRAYESAARSLLSGGGFGSEYARPPLYPIFLAANYLIFGVHILPVRIVQALLGAYSCVLIYSIAGKLFGDNAARVAGWISVVYPYYVFITGLLYPTMITTFLLIATIYLLLSAVEKRSLGCVIWASICLAAAALAVPASLAFTPFLLVWFLWLTDLQWKRRVLFSLVHLVIVVGGIAPWITHGYHQYGKLILIDPRVEKHLPVVGSDGKSQGYAEYGNGERVKMILKYPGRFFLNFAGEFLHFWNFVPDRIVTRHQEYRKEIYQQDHRMVLDNPYASPLMNWISILTYGPVFLLAVAGLFLVRAHRRELVLPLFLLLSHAFAYSLFFTQIRYRLPVEFCLMLLAAAGAMAIVSRLRREKPSF